MSQILTTVPDESANEDSATGAMGSLAARQFFQVMAQRQALRPSWSRVPRAPLKAPKGWSRSQESQGADAGELSWLRCRFFQSRSSAENQGGCNFCQEADRVAVQREMERGPHLVVPVAEGAAAGGEPLPACGPVPRRSPSVVQPTCRPA